MDLCTPDWAHKKERFEAYWERQNTDRCCLAITVANPNGKPVFPDRPFTWEQWYCDLRLIHEKMMNQQAMNDYLFESINARLVDLGTAGHCRFFSAQPHYGDGTIWFFPTLDTPDSSTLIFDEDEFEKQKAFTQALVDQGQGHYFIGMNDHCGIIDSLAHLRGTETLLMDMIEEPEFVHEARNTITKAWIRTQKEFFDIIKDNNHGGSSHAWMHLWSPRRHLQLQCDYSCMISPAMFEEFVLPELEETSAAFEHISYHLDGVEQLRHLDMILSVPGISNIQWTRVAGQPKTSANIEALIKIQKAGKGLVLFPDLDEVEFLLKNLDPRGVQMVIGGVKDHEEAADIEKLARKMAKERSITQ